jgi:hypothetical protein
MHIFGIAAPLHLQRKLPLLFVGVTVFVLCFHGMFYLFEHRNGDSTAPTQIKLLKDFVWAIALFFLFYIGATWARMIDSLRQPHNVILVSFCTWVFAVKVVEVFAYGTYSVMLLAVKNLVLYAAMVPVLGMLDTEIKRSIVKQVLFVFVAVALVQCTFSAALFLSYPEFSFWKNDPYSGFNPFVGFFSNPNRFGLFLSMAAAVLCTVLLVSSARRALLAAAGLLILGLSIFYTGALSQLIVYFGILGYATGLAALKMRWRCLRPPAVGAAAILAIVGLVSFSFKGPWPENPQKGEAELVYDLRNAAALALSGKTLDGEPFRFKSNSVVDRLKEVDNLRESFGSSKQAGSLTQRLFGHADQKAPLSQSMFGYFYFRYGIVGLLLFVGVIAIPAVRGFVALMLRDGKSDADRMLLSYHLCLVAFMATFLGDNGLMDHPTNFLLFFVVFANQWLAYSKLDSSRLAIWRGPTRTR